MGIRRVKNLEAAREIFEDSMLNKENPKGVAIVDCRVKETMVATRYGGDMIFVFFDNITKEQKFIFVAEMRKPRKKKWEEILTLIKKLKTKFIQRNLDD